MGRIFKQLTITDRRKIEKMLAEEMPAKYIADKLRVNVSGADTCTEIRTGQKR